MAQTRAPLRVQTFPPSFPVDLLTWINSSLLIIPPPPVVPAPFSQTAWPNPQMPDWGRNLHTWISGSGERLYPPRFVFRAPLTVPLRPAQPIRSDQWIQNLLETVLGFIPPPPFTQLDWPNPPLNRSIIDLRTWLDGLKRNLQGQDLFFGLAGNPNFDWPNPLPEKLEDKWTFIKSQFQGADNFFGLAGHPNFDQPNPLPVPRRIVEFWLDSLKQNLQGKDALPVIPKDWPNPRQAQRLLDFWIDGLKRNLQGQDNLLIRQADWPNPLLPQHLLDFWIDSLKLKLQGQDALPFRQGDWPNLLLAPPNIGLNTWTDILKRNLIGQDALLIRQLDWPNPLIAVPEIGLKTWLDTLKLKLSGQDALPFRRIDWPTAKGILSSTDQWIQVPLYTTLGRPFAQYDWTNPLAQVYPGQLRVFVNPNTQAILVLDDYNQWYYNYHA